jgi:hypothetical protein
MNWEIFKINDLTQNDHLTRRTHTNISMLFQYRYDAAGVTRALNFFKERSFYADDHPSKRSFTPIRLAQTFRCRVVKLDSLHDFDLKKTTFCTSFRTFLISFLRKTFIIKFLIAYYF